MKILRNAKRKPIGDKLAISDAIAAGAAGVTALSGSAAALAALATAKTNLDTAADAALEAANAAKAAVDIQNDKEDLWAEKLEALLLGLESNAAVTLDMLHAMGLEVAKDKGGSMIEVTEPTAFSITMGDHHNELNGGWNPVPGARGYFLEVTTTPNDAASWHQVATATRSSCTLTGLTTGTTYYVRVRAFGAAGNGPYSTVEMAVAP